MLGAFAEGICADTNQTCACTNRQFESTVAICVSNNCTIEEGLSTCHTLYTPRIMP